MFGPKPRCDVCFLWEQKKVMPEGNRNARMALVGMGPGWQEEVQGRPFVGPSGRLLNRMLETCGIKRGDLWIDNCAMCRPKSVEMSNGEWLSKKETEKRSIKHCGETMLARMQILRPRVIVAFGGQPMETLTGWEATSISKRHAGLHTIDLDRVMAQQRGEDVSNWAFSEAGTTYVIPLFHPAFLLQNRPGYYPILTNKLKRAWQIAQGAIPESWQELLVASHVHDPNEKLRRALAWAQRLAAEGETIGVDVEATEEGARTATFTVFGFGSRRYNFGIAISVLEWDQRASRYRLGWNREQLQIVVEIIRTILHSAAPKEYHNFGYDVTLLRRYEKHLGKLLDTLVKHYLFQPDLLHNLGFACQAEVDAPAWKHNFRTRENKGTAGNAHLLSYNAQDCRHMVAAEQVLLYRAFHAGNLRIYENQMHNAELGRRLQLNGVPLDLAVYREVIDGLKEKRAGTRQTLREMIRDSDGAEDRLNESVIAEVANPDKFKRITLDNFNPRSAREARWFLYEFLGLDPLRWTAGGAEGLNKQPSHAIKALTEYMSNPSVQTYIEFIEAGQTISNPLRPLARFYDPDTGCVHASWGSASMKGTRMTSSPNMQNWQKKLREILVAPPGRIWVGADFSQIEYRIAACFAGIPELLELFNAPEFDEDKEGWKKLDGKYDAHSMVAAEVFGDNFISAQYSPEMQAEAADVAEAVLLRATLGFFTKDPQTWQSEDPRLVARDLQKAGVRISFDRLVKAVQEVYTGFKTKNGLRTLVKRVVYALFYGAMPPKIFTSLREDKRLSPKVRALLTLDRISKIHEGFSQRFPEWDRWADVEMQQVLYEGFQVFPPLDRYRNWQLADLGGVLEPTKIRNTPIQLTAGDLVNEALWKIETEIYRKGLDAKFSIHLHDAGYWNTLKEHAEMVKEIVNRHFDFYLTSYAGYKVHIFGQAGLGPTAADVG